jgi:hypothetical protein
LVILTAIVLGGLLLGLGYLTDTHLVHYFGKRVFHPRPRKAGWRIWHGLIGVVFSTSLILVGVVESRDWFAGQIGRLSKKLFSKSSEGTTTAEIAEGETTE